VTAEVETAILGCPGFFRVAPPIDRYADALPDEVVRWFLRCYDPNRPIPWLMYFDRLEEVFQRDNLNGHFPAVKTMLMGRALKHRGAADLSEAVFVAVYRIVAHMVAQLMDAYSHTQIRDFQHTMEVECGWMFV
jgi:hypothetical protein